MKFKEERGKKKDSIQNNKFKKMRMLFGNPRCTGLKNDWVAK